ncbi:MAG: Fic family protein [Phycisphaerales bacterium]|nr:Fic family protein [Phycisphaerales bacterium]
MEFDAPPLKFSDLPERETFPRIPSVGTREHELLLGDYRPWYKVRPIARDLNLPPEEAWAIVKSSRLLGLQQLELAQAGGEPFYLCMGPHALKPLHRIDRETGGGGASALNPDGGELGDDAVRTKLRIRTLMDEAYESSRIEGASTTRSDAIQLLREQREPKTIAERMVVNNYLAMQRIKTWLDKPLSMEMLIELQTLLTRDTLDKTDQVGRLRRSDEPIRVVDVRTNRDIHVPPNADALPERLDRLFRFANTRHDRGAQFIHPVVKACILHFMIGYEHPFADGNGRTARAVFYWFALRHGYSIFEYTAISELIRKGFARYPQAYVDSELDEGDLTYFVLYKLDIIEQALQRLAEHIKNETTKIKRSEDFLRLSKDLNLRQRLLLEHALRHPHAHYTVKSHMNSNGITANTSRADLNDLVRRRFMTTLKREKEVLYLLAPGFDAKLQSKLNRTRR